MNIPAPLRPYKRRFSFFRTVTALMLREMASSYGRSPGGYLWALLDPIAGIALLSFLFSFIMNKPALGTSFPLFYATGLLVFTMYMGLSNQMTNAINYSKAFMSYPAVTFLDALLARFFLNALTHLLITLIVIGGIIIIFDLKLILDWSAIFLALSMALSLAFGIGTLNCYLSSRFGLWQQLWGVVQRPMFMLAGIFFLPETLPARFRDLFMLNPMAHFVVEMRKGFYATYDGVYASPLYVFTFSLAVGIVGLFLLLRNHKYVAQL